MKVKNTKTNLVWEINDKDVDTIRRIKMDMDDEGNKTFEIMDETEDKKKK